MNKLLDGSYHPPAPNFYTGRGTVLATRANLPHWNKSSTASFVTFRLADALPQEKLLKILEGSGVDLSCEAVGRPLPREGECEAVGRPLPREGEPGSAFLSDSYSATENAIQEYLDAGYGSCVLRNAECRQIVEETLWHFASERYALYAYVVMPNHVHVLFMPTEGWTLSETVAGWKKFAARRLNDILGREGPLWQKESFDTLVRSERHFTTIVGYIKRNDPATAWVAYR